MTPNPQPFVHPDPRWINGEPIVRESQGAYYRADGRVIQGIRFGVIEGGHTDYLLRV